jgi:hypothetical protein
LPGPVADDQNTSTFPSSAEETSENMTTLNMLKEQHTQYKRAAVQAKRADNSDLAIKYAHIAKVWVTSQQTVLLQLGLDCERDI